MRLSDEAIAALEDLWTTTEGLFSGCAGVPVIAQNKRDYSETETRT